jgi:hypothetical protein
MEKSYKLQSVSHSSDAYCCVDLVLFPDTPTPHTHKKGRQDKCLRIPHTNRKVEFVQKALVRLTPEWILFILFTLVYVY